MIKAAPYGHAFHLITRCIRGCGRYAVCVSERDNLHICAACALIEEREDEAT